MDKPNDTSNTLETSPSPPSELSAALSPSASESMLVPAAAPPASLSAQYDELATEYQELARASVALVKAIHTMRASPEHKHVFELYAAHRFTYSGPDVILEMVAVVETIGRHRAG